MRERKSWIAAAAIVALFSACKGESPTAPPTGGGNPPGGTTPPTGVNLTLTTSSTDPLIDSTVIITATATQNNQAVPNGTAVEFETTDGIFDDTANLKETVKTTTNGVATVRLSKSTIGAVTVRATVNNVSRTIGVTFREKPVVTPPPGTAPTISSVSPTIGRPAGGQTIRITGTNFKVPLRVFFTNGGVSPVEGFVVNSTDTTIDVVTPAVNVGAGQQFISDVIVITEAGTPREQRVTRTSAFTFRNESLTPRVSTATPNSGPVTGSTRVTIIGDGFQAPVQVLFGTAEARVITVNFSEILVESPPARDTTSNGSGAFTGPVDITVRNINSATSVVLTQGFSYKNAVQITAMGPTEGIFTGGTRVQIDGTGFVEPVAVVIGGIAARPISVSGTRIIALTSGISITGCSDQGGPTTVTNIVNGDTADGPQFLFRVPKPAIVSVIDVNGPPTLAGESVDVVVANALPGTNRITIGDRTVFITGSTTNSNGTTTFTVTLPTNFTFANQACTLAGVAGTRQVPIDLDVTYLNVQSTCTDTATGALTVEPPTTDCIVPPAPNANITPVTPPCTNMGNVSATGTTTGSTTFTITNTGGQPLVISNVAVVSNTNATTITPSPTSVTIAPQGSSTFTVTVDPASAAPFGGTIRVNSNDPDTPALDFCFTGNGT